MARIWIDADTIPRVFKEVLIKACQRSSVALVFVANAPLGIRKRHLVQTVQVAAGAEVADDDIAENCEEDVLVVTADIPLAARVFEAGSVVLIPRSTVINKENISEKLSMRDFATDLHDIGIETGGAPKRQAEFFQWSRPLAHKRVAIVLTMMDRYLKCLEP